jgi:alpha-L-rhamnosidase
VGKAISELWLENRRRVSAIGISEVAPRISWTLEPGAVQSWVEIELTQPDGSVERYAERTANSRLIAWPFSELGSRASVSLRIRVGRDDRVETSDWSDPLPIEVGLLHRSDWVVPFISPSPEASEGVLRPGYLLRAEFDLRQLDIDLSRVVRGRIYSSAHGVYSLEFNGRPLSDELLSPGWTSYRHRLRYQTTEVLDHTFDGPNTIGVRLADGWYRGHIGFDGGVWDYYGSDASILLQLEYTLDDGTIINVPLTDSWTFSESPITGSGLYEGESYNATLEQKGWSSPGFDNATWEHPALLALEGFPAAIEAPTGPPVRVIETLKPVASEELEDGRIRLDFGQNIAGKLRIRPRGSRGHKITLHHAEVLEDGLLGTRPLRKAISIDSYICAGTGTEEWTPEFTLHGFRYAEIENWPGGLDALDVEALVVHSDMQRTGWFESSHAGLNRLHENVVWSMRDNFVDLPTDCPQRDERMGWTGDIQVFAPTAFYLYAAHGTLTGWLRDVAAEQAEQGHVPNFVPWVECGFPNYPTAAWGDAAVIVPWEMYRHDGDTRILREQYSSMKAWVDLVDSLASDSGLWDQGFQLGDWLDPAAPPHSPGDSETEKSLVATAYLIKSSRIVAETAAILGQESDAARYQAIALRSLSAFRDAFIATDGTVLNDTVTAISVCLVFDLFESASHAAVAGARLIELVAEAGYRISTGFVGTPIVCDALVLAGGLDTAYALLLQDELPSWLYPVSMGATTIWERWDSMLPDGSINPGDMTSFNHYALGAVADFMHRVVAGLSAEGAGSARLRIAPRPGGGLTRASARHHGPLGIASSSWRRVGTSFELEVEVPPGASATVVMPGNEIGSSQVVGPGRHTFQSELPKAESDWAPDARGARKEAAR